MHFSVLESGTQTAAIKLSTEVPPSLEVDEDVGRAPLSGADDEACAVGRLTGEDAASAGVAESDSGMVGAPAGEKGIAMRDRRRWRRMVCSSSVLRVRSEVSRSDWASRMALIHSSFSSGEPEIRLERESVSGGARKIVLRAA